MSERSQILTRAREIVAEDGWCQGSYKLWSPDRRCLWSALEQAAEDVAGTYFNVRQRHVLSTALGLPEATYLIAYNDLPSTTEADILFLLDEWIADGSTPTVQVEGGENMDESTTREDIEEIGLDGYLQARFAKVVEEAGKTLYGPEFRADEVMNRHLTIELAQDVASTVKEWERSAQPA